MPIGLSDAELQHEIRVRMAALDDAQQEAEQLGPYGDLLRVMAQTAFQRAADLIAVNNRRIAEQLAAAGVALPKRDGELRVRE